jgi:glutamine amidotransferase
MALVIVDYHKGNIRSVQKGLELAGADTLVSDDYHDIMRADAIVLPGVGAFADAADYMWRSGQMSAIQERIADGACFLGICLGLHLLLDYGEEGVAEVGSREHPDDGWVKGLGVIGGYARRLSSRDSSGRSYKVPHVGWNQVQLVGQPSPAAAALFDGIEDGSNFYFTHSYQGVAKDEAAVMATVTHATSFPSVICKDRVFGLQFHPEKSSHKGLQVLKNFAGIVRQAWSI